MYIQRKVKLYCHNESTVAALHNGGALGKPVGCGYRVLEISQKLEDFLLIVLLKMHQAGTSLTNAPSYVL